MAAGPRDRGKLSQDAIAAIGGEAFQRWLGQPIGLNAHEKPRPEILRRAKDFVDIAFAIAAVHTALGRAQKRGGLMQILEPAITFFGLDRHARLVHEPPERSRSFELAAGPELHPQQAEWSSAGGGGQTRMHQHDAHGAGGGLSGFIAPALMFCVADLAGQLATLDELGRI